MPMKRGFYVLNVLWLLFSVSVYAGGGKGGNKSCGENGFSTEVIKAELTDKGCIRYTLEVSHNNKCQYALSHYTVAVSCGKVYNVSNSQGWKIEYGYDKTTKLTGFKIDDIPNFGETKLKKFTVSFTVCQDGGKKCATREGCCYPTVAYKAGQCVYYDKLENACPSPPEEPEAELKASLDKEDITCFGGGNGSLSVVIEEGKEPYTYEWSTGASTAVIDGLAPGEYSVKITDANGNQIELSETITEPEALALTGVVTNEACANGAGAIDITITGGTAPFTFKWNEDLATTEDLDGLHAGLYKVLVTDQAGCTKETTFEVKNNKDLTITSQSTMPACGQSNGSITISVSGGTEPYTYAWRHGSQEKDLVNIGPNTYWVTVTDANGCSSEHAVVLKENNTLKLTWIATQTSCQDDGSGAIDLTVEGGTGPYTYSWTNGQSSEDLSGLSAGFYDVTVTDAAGCQVKARISITKKTFQINSNVIQPACDGSQGGSVSLFPINTSETYTYQWSNGSTGSSVEGLEPGIYSVDVTDGSGCQRTLIYVITDPTGITASATVSNDQCNSEGAYSIDLTISGGSGPYSYEWSNGSTEEDPTGLESGTYTVAISDVNGCSTTLEVVVSGTPPAWSCVIADPGTETVCSTSGNVLGSSIADADSYSWTVQSSDGQWIINSGHNASTISYTSGGANSSATFSLTIVKDGCSQTCEFEVTTCKDETGDPGEDPEEDPDQDPDENPDEDPDQDPGEDPGSPGGNESCSDCFDTEIVSVEKDGHCFTYRMEITTNGNCRYDLSHWTVAVPCGKISHYSNSENWKMELGKDPTTGLYGLKVDDIDNFGGFPDSFTVTFKVCSDDYHCKSELKEWEPKVAYKAGQCVAYDKVTGEDPVYEEPEGPVCKAYPNPFTEKLTFEWTADEDDDVRLDLLDTQGNHVKSLYCGRVYRGERYKVECGDLTKSMYIYRFNSKKKTSYGKICKIR